MTPTPCPACAGLSQPDHPGGLLAGWHHAMSCELLAHEDGRAVADDEALYGRRRFTRPATTTERALLTACGQSWPEPLETTVAALTDSVRRRTWPTATTT